MLKGAFLATLKGKIIAGAAALVVVGGVAAGVVIATNNAKYRAISVEEVTGTVTATGEKKNGQLLVGEHLISGDFVSVATESGLTMCADKTKYLYADPETSFRISSENSSKSKNLEIFMESGSTLHELKEKLGEGDTYRVDTPNSTMSVRGTTFRVTVYRDSKGTSYTLTEVESGTVVIQLKTKTGEFTGEEEAVEAGESALVRDTETSSEFVKSRKGTDTMVLDYDKLPDESVDRLIALITEKPAEIIGEHEHEAGEWEEDTPATCTESGLRVKRCTICDEVMEVETLDPLGHTEGNWEIEVEPTCTEPGKQVKKCTVCGEILETEEIEATGHVKSDEWTVVLEPECETAGRQAKLCTVCGEELETKTIKKTGHKYGKWQTTKEATCTDQGERKRVCSICEKEQKETTAALGHDMKEVSRDNATCTAGGHVDYKCSRCDVTRTDSLAALGHNWVDDILEEPSCTGIGYAQTKCSRCGTEVGDSFHEVAALGHIYVRGQEVEPGVYNWTCSRCEHTIQSDTQPNPLED